MLILIPAPPLSRLLKPLDSMFVSRKFSHDLSEITEFGLDDIAAIVLDYDPDVHGPAIAETLNQYLPPRPLVFVSSDQGSRPPLMLTGGSVRHLTKPVTAERLAGAIEKALDDWHCHSMNCDRWGHPCSNPQHSCANAGEEELVSEAC